MKMIFTLLLLAALSFNIASCFPKNNGENLYESYVVNNAPYTMPDECKGQTYCHIKGADYPDEEDVDEALQKYGMLKTRSKAISARQGDAGDFHCSGQYINTPIYYIVDENHMTRAVLQSAQYTQQYEIRACNKEGKPHKDCNEDILGTLQVRPICENQYMSFEFHVFGISELTVELARAMVPVCCKCRYEQIFE